jgi:CelD/BcsL family acetyltransferase involved in cellulose biosynthesis
MTVVNVATDTVAPPAVHVDIVPPPALDADQRAAWRRLQQISAASAPAMDNPFLSVDFAVAVGTQRPAARVAVLTRDGQHVGFFAYEQVRRGVAKPIGATISDCQGPVLDPALDMSPRQLLAACDLQVWEYDHLTTALEGFASHHAVVDDSPVMWLADGWQAYRDERRAVSKSLLSGFERKARKLARDVGPLRFALHTGERNVLEHLMRWKSAQYRATGVPDRFGQPWIARALRALMSSGRQSDVGGCLSALWAGDRLVAAHAGLRSATILSWWFPAFDPAFARYSPGAILLLRMAEAAAASGVRQVDLGRGHHPYKERFASTSWPVAEGWVERPGVATVVRRIQRIPHRIVLHAVMGTEREDQARRLLRRAAGLRARLDGNAFPASEGER